ncbi:serine/threonine protein kinase [Roseibacillus ishigakijimensis]|uniref:Serine/threonine protein kinase n=1 Tax=Roseibacillus ishigakijimensis TaxID=454146 RepID=A0A934VM53_9BACT|nr:serine/threonine-protein kinase [Roseibacillus ishigakijimensis]MBK1835384.1 serine/threonine protein kinase [Roseibacillus ishigakijimensis]
MKPPPPNPATEAYRPDYRLTRAYHEATGLTPDGLDSLCPSYLALCATGERYQEQTLLGQGGVKQVFRAFDTHTRRWVALARLRPRRGPDFYDRFVHEAWLTASLRHPNIINVHEVGVAEDQRPFFTMDLKGNQTLRDLVAKSGNEDPRPLLAIFLKVCDALAYAHSQGVLHLDLKPENIQAQEFGEVLVCDWGSGRRQSEAPAPAPSSSPPEDPLANLTLQGLISGTPGYMAPEQLDPAAAQDHRTDLYALGCILHFLLTGRAPFTGSTAEVLTATARGHIPPPHEAYPTLSLPPSLVAIILRATRPDPADRYPTVSALREDLQRYLDGFATEAEQPNFLKEARLFILRNRLPVAIALTSFALLTVLTTLFVQRLEAHRQQVLAEKERSSHLAARAEVAQNRYLAALSRSQQEQKALALDLALSANRLKNMGIYQRPYKTVRQASELAHIALTLDPTSGKARYELYSLNLIQMNFQAALTLPTEGDIVPPGYQALAQAFPHFAYSPNQRPGVSQLRQFFSHARTHIPDQAPLLERLLAYDQRLRRSHHHYHLVIEDFLRYLNPTQEGIRLHYEEDEAKLTLHAPGHTRLLVEPGGSSRCTLRYHPARTLALISDGPFDLRQLEGLPIKTLDLTRCPSLTLNQALSLPGLNTIHLGPHHPPLAELRRHIVTPGDFQILTSPTENPPHPQRTAAKPEPG